MRSMVLGCIVAVGLFAVSGCNAKTESIGNSAAETAGSKLVNPKITIARGCLTGDSGQFVLTNLDDAAPVSPAEAAAEPLATTDSYRLVGMDDRLKGFVGQRVEVTGDSQPEGVVDLVSATPATAPNTGTTGKSGSDAKVSTASRARVEILDLRVHSVNPLGDKCSGK